MKRLLAGLSGAFIIGALLSPVLVLADVNNFTVTNFAADETLSRADPQGELHIVERIDVEFTDNNHGILRAIPTTYKHHSLQLRINKVSSDSGAPAQYTTYSSNDNTVLKIGDPARTVTGPQEYTIDYTLRNAVTFYNDHDELYWDVNGDQWDQPFTQVSVALHLPADLRLSSPAICYAGSFGSTNQDCTISSQDNAIRATTNHSLSARQTLTYVAAFEKGYFQTPTTKDWLSEYWKQLAGVLLPIIVIGGGSALYWWRKGRDANGRGTIIPQYDAPDAMTPLSVGALLDFKVDNRDITATIIDLAIRGYIKITETKENKLIGKDKLNYKLQLLNPDFAGLSEDEKILMNALFTSLTANSEVDISASKNKLYTSALTLRKQVKTRLKTEGYFRNDPLKSGTVIRALLKVIVIFIIGCLLYVVVKMAFIIGLVIGVLLALPFLMSLDARTAKGVTAKEHVLGLKRYLEVAEKDRLEKLQGPDAAYAADRELPVKTVELFEKLLPFAMVLGVEKQWAEQFESLYASPPDWYSGNWDTFSASYLASSLGDGIGPAVNTAFSAPSSSGGSGFSGGSSGGGGGGGGGGGW